MPNMKKEEIRTPYVRFEIQRISAAKVNLATGFSQASVFLQKELVICITICYNKIKEMNTVVPKSKWGFKYFW